MRKNDCRAVKVHGSIQYRNLDKQPFYYVRTHKYLTIGVWIKYKLSQQLTGFSIKNIYQTTNLCTISISLVSQWKLYKSASRLLLLYFIRIWQLLNISRSFVCCVIRDRRLIKCLSKHSENSKIDFIPGNNFAQIVRENHLTTMSHKLSSSKHIALLWIASRHGRPPTAQSWANFK